MFCLTMCKSCVILHHVIRWITRKESPSRLEAFVFSFSCFLINKYFCVMTTWHFSSAATNPPPYCKKQNGSGLVGYKNIVERTPTHCCNASIFLTKVIFQNCKRTSNLLVIPFSHAFNLHQSNLPPFLKMYVSVAFIRNLTLKVSW